VGLPNGAPARVQHSHFGVSAGFGFSGDVWLGRKASKSLEPQMNANERKWNITYSVLCSSHHQAGRAIYCRFLHHEGG
jgi:hypothetical protein